MTNTPNPEPSEAEIERLAKLAFSANHDCAALTPMDCWGEATAYQQEFYRRIARAVAAEAVAKVAGEVEYANVRWDNADRLYRDLQARSGEWLAKAERDLAAARARLAEVEAALNALVDNAGGYDRSVIGSAIVTIRQTGRNELADRLGKLERDGRAALAATADGGGVA